MSETYFLNAAVAYARPAERLPDATGGSEWRLASTGVCVIEKIPRILARHSDVMGPEWKGQVVLHLTEKPPVPLALMDGEGAERYGAIVSHMLKCGGAIVSQPNLSAGDVLLPEVIIGPQVIAAVVVAEGRLDRVALGEPPPAGVVNFIVAADGITGPIRDISAHCVPFGVGNARRMQERPPDGFYAVGGIPKDMLVIVRDGSEAAVQWLIDQLSALNVADASGPARLLQTSTSGLLDADGAPVRRGQSGLKAPGTGGEVVNMADYLRRKLSGNTHS